MRYQLLLLSGLLLLITACNKKKREDPPSNFGTACTCQGQYYSLKSGNDTLVWLPSAFTPNGDGKNDVLRPVILPGRSWVTDYRFSVSSYDMVFFTTTSPDSGWTAQNAGTGKYTASVNFKTPSGQIIDACLCVYVLQYNADSNCIPGAQRSYIFEDQLNMATGLPEYPTAEIFCR